MSTKQVIYDFYKNCQEEAIKKYGDNTVVLLQVGSFYEIYSVDNLAENIGKILGMQTTLYRKKHECSWENPKMTGFPDYALCNHLGKILANGYTVLVYNQTDKKLKKGKERLLADIYSPSTFIDTDFDNINNILAVIYLHKFNCPIDKKSKIIAFICIIDNITAKIELMEIYNSEKIHSEIYRILHSVNPSEIIFIGKSIPENPKKYYELKNVKIIIENINKEYLNPEYQKQFLNKIYHNEKLGLEKYPELIFVLINGLEFINHRNSSLLKKIKKPIIIKDSSLLILNNETLTQLGIISDLYPLINNTKTNMGERLLKYRLLFGTRNPELLNEQYSKIKNIKNSKEISEKLKGMIDITKYNRKLIIGKIQPFEFSKLYISLVIADDLFSTNLLIDDKSFSIKKLKKCLNEINETLNVQELKCKLTDKKLNLFINEPHQVIKTRKQAKKALDLLESIREKFNDYSEYNAFKLEFGEKTGYYLETTRKKWNLLKNFNETFTFSHSNYIIDPQNMEITFLKNNVKISDNFIRILSKSITECQSEINKINTSIWCDFITNFSNKWSTYIDILSNIIAEIDLNSSFHIFMKTWNYCIPSIDNINNYSSYSFIKDLRNPVIEMNINQTSQYTPNDLLLDSNKGILIYGLNTCGKSSYLRSLGFAIVMAQAGLPVAAKNMNFFPFGNIITKIMVQDKPAQGKSLYQVELDEINSMVQFSDKNTLILADELCNSTEAPSAHGLVAAIMLNILSKNACFLFTTHLHKLSQFNDIKTNPNIKIQHFAMHIENGKIINDRKLIDGPLNGLYGLEIAGTILNNEIIEKAIQFRKEFEEINLEILSFKKSKYNKHLYVDSCSKCGSKKNLHTHHINPQKNANDFGIIDNFHKNSKFNLEILCDKCHKLEHSHFK